MSDVISGVVAEPIGMKVRVKFGDTRSSRSRDIRMPHFVRTTTTTTQTDGPYDNTAKRRSASFCPKPFGSVGAARYAQGPLIILVFRFLPLDEDMGYRAGFIIVSGSDGRAELLLEPAK